MTPDEVKKHIATTEKIQKEMTDFIDVLHKANPHLDYINMQAVYFTMRIAKLEDEIKELKSRKV